MFDPIFRNRAAFVADFDRLHRSLDRWLGTSALDGNGAAASSVFPPINIHQDRDALELFAFVPGIRSEDLEITAEAGRLTIAGTRSEALSEGESAQRTERFSGSFRRTVALPDDADLSSISASCRDGLLRLHVARKAPIAHRVQIH